jgi:Zn-dependent oligopeptidase
MKNCSDRSLRKKLYDEYYSRASYTTVVPFGNNAENVTNIIKLRGEMAKLLGFKSYTHFILETKTSANIDSIYETLEL